MLFRSPASCPSAAQPPLPDPLQAHSSLESRPGLQAHTSLDKTVPIPGVVVLVLWWPLILRRRSFSKASLQRLPEIVATEQAREVVEALSSCGECGHELPKKAAASMVYRTAFGKLKSFPTRNEPGAQGEIPMRNEPGGGLGAAVGQLKGT